MPSDLDTLNQRFYQSRAIADWYATKDFILPEEQAFMDRHAPEVVDGKSLLDIGIGAGRTTRFLLPCAGRYVGVDYSPDMIATASARFPDATLHVRDARDLSAYADGEFDTVVFSFNGLDCLSFEGRLAAMKEIGRVLKPGGAFIFSSHNRDQNTPGPFSASNLSFSKHPLRMLANVRRYLGGIGNYLGTRTLAYAAAAHEMRHDSSNVFAAPICYVTKQAQCETLASLGFEVVSIFDRSGKASAVSDLDRASSWILYVCRKHA
ncbi:MAG: class I SAM-dependent methyltransferase [Verrucomicrobiaceae bacterium]|nr:class I SAM-dependent methyltransferase [Verrucomicrobiaceae bacterium]